MAFQDDTREDMVRQLLKLKKNSSRSGVDAYHQFSRDDKEYIADIELKSTSKDSVTTARDVGIDHLVKWRSRIWIIAYFNQDETLKSILCLSPKEMEPWIVRKENYVKPDILLGEIASTKLDIDDLYHVCEQKAIYSVDDAKALHKKQWNKSKYQSNVDYVQGTTEGYSPSKMLEILQQRTKYLVQRGITLNNPHIPKTFLAQFTEKEIPAERLRDTATIIEIHREIERIWLEYSSKA